MSTFFLPQTSGDKGSAFKTRVDFYWVSWFALCLIPYSLPGGYSANYLFALTPLIFLMNGRNIYYSKPFIIRLYFIICILIFILSSLYQLEFIEQLERRVISFVIFMTQFSLLLLYFNQKIINSFLMAIVLVSLYLSSNALIGAVEFGLVSDPATLKNVVGSQRVAFIYLFALGIVFHILINFRLSFWIFVLFLVTTVILLFGVILAFSRASILALLAGLFFCLLSSNSRHFPLGKRVVLVLTFLFLGFLLWNALPTYFDYFLRNLVYPLFHRDYAFDLDDQLGSEGARLAIWRLIIDYVALNPLTGSGFLGS